MVFFFSPGGRGEGGEEGYQSPAKPPNTASINRRITKAAHKALPVLRHSVRASHPNPRLDHTSVCSYNIYSYIVFVPEAHKNKSSALLV